MDSTPVSAPASLADVIASSWAPDDRVLLELPDGARITYGEARARVDRLAGALVAAGAQPGERVAVQVEKSPEALFVYLACLRTGAVLLPMNPAYTDDEVAYLVGDAEPRVVVRDPTRTGPPVDAAVLTLDRDGAGTLADEAARQPATFEPVPRRPDDLAAILYTSGTTGRPKGAMLTHWNLASNALALTEAWGFTADDVLLHALPIFHTHGLFVATNCTLLSGSSMLWLPRFDVDAVLERLPRATVFMGVPTYYTRLLADPRLDADVCRNVRLFTSGSAPLLAGTHAAFRDRTGHVILERYGMTETSMLTSNPLHGERRAGTVGPPLPGVDVRVTGPRGVVADGTIGDVEVRGPNVFAGYWRKPDVTAREMTADGWFRTGDQGFFDADGYLHLVGRSKDLVISGGLNVYPSEVETVLDELPGVDESAVIGVPDPDLGEAVVAVVVPVPGATVDPEAVRTAARERLAGFKVPKRVNVVDALPRNAMGKVEKARLRERFRR